jgi:hypothetical protein
MRLDHIIVPVGFVAQNTVSEKFVAIRAGSPSFESLNLDLFLLVVHSSCFLLLPN